MDDKVLDRIERFVGGIRDEFLKETKESLAAIGRHRSGDVAYRKWKLALEAYVEWATSQ